MKAKFFLLSSLLLTLVSCEQKSGLNNSDVHNRDRTNSGRESVENSERVDNTGRNVRDRDLTTITPGDQPENEKDRMIIKEIRQRIVADDSMSFNGKNVKIVSKNGNVILRGVVENNQEKGNIEKIASSVAGVGGVKNELEIKIQ